MPRILGFLGLPIQMARQGWSPQALGAFRVSFPWYTLPEHMSFSSGATPAAWLVDPHLEDLVRPIPPILWFSPGQFCVPVEDPHYFLLGSCQAGFRSTSPLIGFIRSRKSYRGFAPPIPVCIPPCNPRVTQMLPEPSSAPGALVPPELQVIEPDLLTKIRYRNTQVFCPNRLRWDSNSVP